MLQSSSGSRAPDGLPVPPTRRGNRRNEKKLLERIATPSTTGVFGEGRSCALARPLRRLRCGCVCSRRAASRTFMVMSCECSTTTSSPFCRRLRPSQRSVTTSSSIDVLIAMRRLSVSDPCPGRRAPAAARQRRCVHSPKRRGERSRCGRECWHPGPEGE